MEWAIRLEDGSTRHMPSILVCRNTFAACWYKDSAEAEVLVIVILQQKKILRLPSRYLSPYFSTLLHPEDKEEDNAVEFRVERRLYPLPGDLLRASEEHRLLFRK